MQPSQGSQSTVPKSPLDNKKASQARSPNRTLSPRIRLFIRRLGRFNTTNGAGMCQGKPCPPRPRSESFSRPSPPRNSLSPAPGCCGSTPAGRRGLPGNHPALDPVGPASRRPSPVHRLAITPNPLLSQHQAALSSVCRHQPHSRQFPAVYPPQSLAIQGNDGLALTQALLNPAAKGRLEGVNVQAAKT